MRCAATVCVEQVLAKSIVYMWNGWSGIWQRGCSLRTVMETDWV